MKNLFLDLETTGLHYQQHGILEIGGVVEIDGEIVEEFKLNGQPFTDQLINKKALEINKTTLDEIATYQSPEDMYGQFVDILNKYVNRYDSKDKFFMIGYNIYFDSMFLRTFFEKNDNQFMSSYFFWPYLDVAVLLCEQLKEQRSKIEYFNLAAMGKLLGIEFEAHDALADAKACRQIYNQLREE